MLDAVSGKIELTATRAQMVKLAIDKTLPSLATVAIAIQDNRGHDKADIDALLLQAGLTPEMEFKDQLAVVSIIEHEDSD